MRLHKIYENYEKLILIKKYKCIIYIDILQSVILGYVPSQADLRELAVNVEDHEATGTVHLAEFLPYVENAISEYK